MVLKAVLFDFDGTIVDTEPLIFDVIAQVARENGLPAYSYEELADYLGHAPPDFVRHLYPQLSAAQHQALAARYRAIWHEDIIHRLDRLHLFPGMREVLDDMQAQGIPMALVTNRDAHGVSFKSMMQMFDLEKYFTVIKSAPTLPAKPAPDMLLAAMQELGVMPVNAVMVGDTIMDVKAARAAGVPVIVAGWQSHVLRLLKKERVDYAARTVTELHTILQTMIRGDMSHAGEVCSV